MHLNSLRLDLLDKIAALLDFNPKIKVILTVRIWPEHLPDERTVFLHPLNIAETFTYINNHPKSQAHIKGSDIIDRIYRHVAGLPIAIDGLIRQNKDFHILDILNEDEQTQAGSLNEPILKSLVNDIEHFAASKEDDDIRTYELLKLLTVLRDGETLKSIKRIYPTKPFYAKHVSMLSERKLIESIAIVQTASDLSPYKSKSPYSFSDTERLMRVPKQVRDYVVTKITEEERFRIYTMATEVYFGKSWHRGKISWRKSLIDAYQQSSISPPGNELMIAQYLLKSALESNKLNRIDVLSRLALGYCGKLDEFDRFRDLAAAAGAIAGLLDSEPLYKFWITAGYYLGKSLRMQSCHTESIDILNKVLKRDPNVANSFKTSVLINLALSYKSVGDEPKALLCCNQIISLEEKDSGIALQARSVIALISLKGSKLNSELRELYGKAIRHGHTVSAQNIAIELAKYGKTTNESIKYLDSAINSSQNNPYGLTRAITQKTELLIRDGRIAELKYDERRLLCSAYAYSYSQRIGKMLDSCHEALWEICVTNTLWAPLLRLFRYSSFIWRLNGDLDRELVYIAKAFKALPDLAKSDHQEIEVEITYLEARQTDRKSESPA